MSTEHVATAPPRLRALQRGLFRAGSLPARAAHVLRGGWALGLVLTALVILGPAGGSRWVGREVGLARHAVVVEVTRAYRVVYVAAVWPVENAVLVTEALHRRKTAAAHPPTLGKGRAAAPFPALIQAPWSAWWRHGADWRYLRLQAPSARPVRRLLPLEGGGVVLLVVLAGGLVLVGRRRRGLENRPSTTFGGARWQTYTELARRRAKPGDLVLGTARRGLRRVVVGVPSALLVEGVAIDAPSGMGKSNVFYKAHLLEAAPDVDYLITDPKGETWDQTAGALSRTHDVYRLDMLRPDRSVTWNPLALDRTPAQASDWAQALLTNTAGDSAPAQAYFELAMRTMIAAGIGHVHATARKAGQSAGTFSDLTALLLQPTVEKIAAELQKTLGEVDGGGGPAATFLGLIAEHRDLRTSVPSGLAPRLSALIDPAITAVVGGQGTLDLDRLGRTGRRPLALYIVTPPESAAIRPLVAALFTTTFRVLLDRAKGLPGGALEREVRLLCDEFGTMGAVPNVPKIFNICRQARISRVLSFQLRAQLDEDYGETGRAALIESCNALVWLGGTRGDDARWASEVVGNKTALARGEGDTAPRTLFGRRPDRGNQSLSETGVPLLFPEDLHTSSRRRIIVSVREARPMDLRSRPFYAVRTLRRLSTLPAPPACGEAATPAGPAPTAATAAAPASTLAPARADAQVVPAPLPAPMRGAAPAKAPSAPVRVTVATASAAPSPTPAAAATSTPLAAPTLRSGPPRLPTAPVKHGTAYDWTALP